MLEALERGNLFVVPLDDRRRWYRYHRLFADVLHARLVDEQPDHFRVLHRRASAWYERNGEPSEAIRHALAAEDFHKAAELVEVAVPSLRRNRQEATALGWLKALPDELVNVRPVLSATYAWALLACGELEGVVARLDGAERWLDTTTDMAGMGERPKGRSAEMVVVDEAEFRRLPGAIAVSRAAHALALGNVAETMIYARQARDLVSENDHLGRGAASALLGLASWTMGDLEAAHAAYAASKASLQMAGHLSDVLGCAIVLADIRIAQGRLHDAMRTYEQAVQLATSQGAPVLRGMADMHVGMSELHRERGDLETAMQHLVRSQVLGAHVGLPQNPYRWRVAMAGIRQAQGDLSGALDLLHEAESLYVGDFSPNVRPIAALQARVWVAQGRLGEALEWTRERGLSAAAALSYLREFEHITLARVLLAQSKGNGPDHSMPDAMALLQRVLQAADEGGRTGSVIEVLVLQALAYAMGGDIPAALVPLERALALAETEGFVRIFVDEGPPMAALLEAAAGKRRISPDYARKLLAALGKVEDSTPKPVLIDPLSERERDVLRLLGTDLEGPEIARQLMVSLSTVRTHTKNIYSKLGVNNRRAAVKRAEELELLSRTRKH